MDLTSMLCVLYLACWPGSITCIWVCLDRERTFLFSFYAAVSWWQQMAGSNLTYDLLQAANILLIAISITPS